MTFILCSVIIVSAGYGFSRRSALDEFAVQSAHSGVVPRVGGVAIYLSVLALIPLLTFGFIPLSIVFGLKIADVSWLILSAIPVFTIGIFEDLGYSMPPKRRLFASAVSGLLVMLVFKVWISHLGIPGVDTLFSFVPFLGVYLHYLHVLE